VTEAIFLLRARGNEDGGVTPVFSEALVQISTFHPMRTFTSWTNHAPQFVCKTEFEGNVRRWRGLRSFTLRV